MPIKGILILLAFIVGILFLRNAVGQSNSPILKGALKINDAIVWVRFMGGVVLVLFLLFFLTVFGKKH